MQNSFHPASGGGSRVNSRFYEFLKLLHITLKKRKHQVLFTGKVEIDGTFGNANTSCYLVHGHFVIALLDQHFFRCLENKRSEERRVGKECRLERMREHL